MMNKRKCGFTLVEMLVVVLIITVLVLLLMPSIGKIRRRAWRVACASNLKQLYQAEMNRATGGRLTAAASTEGWHHKEEMWRRTRTGWVDWYHYESHSDDEMPDEEDMITYWWSEKAEDCIKNGSLWPYVKDVRIYACPHFRHDLKHIDVSDDEHRDVWRSYVMNAHLNHASWMGIAEGGGVSRRALYMCGAYEAKYGAAWGLQDEGDTDENTHQWHRHWCRGYDGMLQSNVERIGDWHDGKGMVVFLDGHVDWVHPNDTADVCTGNWGE